MKDVFKKLKDKSIIDSQKVEVIRRYIKNRFPDAPQKQQGAIFADAVHKLIDGNIYQFDESQRKNIKDKVFRKAATRSSFFINADEIFSSALSIKDYGNGYFDSLEQWVSTNQSSKVSKEELMNLAEKLKDVSFEDIEDKLEEVINVIDEQEKIEKRIKEISLSMGLGEITKTETPLMEEPFVQEIVEQSEPPKKAPKKLFAKAEKPDVPPWDLDKEIKSVLQEPKPMDKLSVMGKKPVEVKENLDTEKRISMAGKNVAANNLESDGFSRKDADVFFDVMNDNRDSREKRFRAHAFSLLGTDIGKSILFRNLPSVKKARLQDVLIQMIILLVLIVSTGTVLALGEKGKEYIKVPDQITKPGGMVDTYSDIFDMYLTKESKDLK